MPGIDVGHDRLLEDDRRAVLDDHAPLEAEAADVPRGERDLGLGAEGEGRRAAAAALAEAERRVDEVALDERHQADHPLALALSLGT